MSAVKGGTLRSDCATKDEPSHPAPHSFPSFHYGIGSLDEATATVADLVSVRGCAPKWLKHHVCMTQRRKSSQKPTSDIFGDEHRLPQPAPQCPNPHAVCVRYRNAPDLPHTQGNAVDRRQASAVAYRKQGRDWKEVPGVVLYRVG